MVLCMCEGNLGASSFSTQIRILVREWGKYDFPFHLTLGPMGGGVGGAQLQEHI